MTSIVIFDDDRQSISNLRSLTEQAVTHGHPCTISEASSLDELKEILERNARIDILIADIIMPEGELSGIEVVKRLFPPESGTQVIYVSGYLDQAPEVYQTEHLYFLLKPVDPKKFRDAMGRAFTRLTRRKPLLLRVKTGRNEQLINISTIRYLESSLHKVTIHCRSHDVVTYARLDDLQEQLPSSFSRCHRSYLVNLAYVSRLGEDDLKLHDGTLLPISRRRARQTQRDMLAYLSARSKELP